jgi:hypothetical protein
MIPNKMKEALKQSDKLIAENKAICMEKLIDNQEKHPTFHKKYSEGMSRERLLEILTVYTVTRPNLRDDEMLLYVGQGFLRDLFDTDKDMSEYKKVVLQYPERWLNILEQRSLIEAVQRYCPLLEKLEIRTHSAFILQSSPTGTVYIVDNPDKYPEVGYTRGVRFSPLSSPDPGITVFRMSDF